MNKSSKLILLTMLAVFMAGSFASLVGMVYLPHMALREQSQKKDLEINNLRIEISNLRTGVMLMSRPAWYFQGGSFVSSEPNGKGEVVELGLSSLALLTWFPATGLADGLKHNVKFTFEYTTQERNINLDLVLGNLLRVRKVP